MIERTVAKILTKKFIRRLLKRLYGICSSTFSNLEVIFSRLKVSFSRHEQKRSFAGFETGFVSFFVVFLALDFILSLSEVPSP